MSEPTAIVVFITAASREEAERLANVLVERRLAACVQILPQITSVYRWQNQIQTDAEILILAKTIDSGFAELEQAVRENLSYDVPEIVAVSVNQISQPYLKWLLENAK